MNSVITIISYFLRIVNSFWILTWPMYVIIMAMEVSEVYKHFGLLSAALLTPGLLFVVLRWPQGKHRTFSQHIATSKTAIIYYVLLFSIVLPLLVLFFLKWFIPYFRFSSIFTVSIIVAALLQFLCTLIPEVGGWKSTIHRALAFLSADLLLIPVLLVTISPFVSTLARATSLLSFAVMASIALLLIRSKAEHKYLLILQSGFFAMFFITVLTTTYS